MKRDNPFDYLEVEGDPTKQNILEKEKFHGYDPSSPLTFDYSTYEDLCNSIFADDEIVFSSRSLGHFASKKQLRNSLSIWEDLKIDLHEIDMLDKSYKNVNNGYFIITQEFLDAMKLVHPFELPVLFNKRKNGEIYGQLENIAITGPDDDPDDNMVLYTNIELSRLNNKITTCLYNHEITHTQSCSRKSCRSILDLETLPIFIEELFASKIDASGDTLEKIRNIRLLEIVRMLDSYLDYPNMAYVCRIESDTYIKSTFQAIQLFNTYLTGNQNLKKEMENHINDIFAEESSVQDMLNRYNANMDEVPKCLKKLKIPR